MILPIDFEFIIKAEADETNERDDDLKYRAKDHAKGDAHDATIEKLDAKDVDAAGEPCDADKDADIIDRWGESKEDETTDGLLDRGKDGGDGH